MFRKLKTYLQDVQRHQRVGVALSKGGAMMHARNIDLTQPETWEFSGFSQNGEDGIIDVLRKQLRSSNRYCVEIGASDGVENNTSWLIIAEKYSGVMVEGDPDLVERANRMIACYSTSAEYHHMLVSRDNVKDLKPLVLHQDPDIFSLDIDGNDYYVAQAILDSGIRPKIFVVEYNSVYGPEQSMTIEYQEGFVFTSAHPTQLYYGVSIAGWRKFFESQGYRFVTVDRSGVNAFFVDPACFDPDFLGAVKGVEFNENRYQQRKFRMPSKEQFVLVADQQFISI